MRDEGTRVHDTQIYTNQSKSSLDLAQSGKICCCLGQVNYKKRSQVKTSTLQKYQ